MTWHPDIPEEYRNQIVTGDARELAKAIPDESVDLVFTDPVYDRIDDYRWLAETAARVLKPDRACLVFAGIGYLPETHDAVRAGGLSYRWQLIMFYSNLVSQQFAGFNAQHPAYCNIKCCGISASHEYSDFHRDTAFARALSVHC